MDDTHKQRVYSTGRDYKVYRAKHSRMCTKSLCKDVILPPAHRKPWPLTTKWEKEHSNDI